MKKQRTSEEWSKLLELYDSRECSKAKFCEEHGVSSASLSSHMQKRNAKQGFKRASIAPTAVSIETILEFPNGLRLTVRG